MSVILLGTLTLAVSVWICAPAPMRRWRWTGMCALVGVTLGGFALYDTDLYDTDGVPRPSPESVEALVNADAATQAMRIEGMVQGLSARLESEGGSAEEWLMLTRALVVLDRGAEAEAAFARTDTSALEEGALIELARLVRQSSDGQETPLTKSILQAVLAHNPTHVEARIFLALARDHIDHDSQAARQELEALKASLGQDAGALKQGIETLIERLR